MNVKQKKKYKHLKNIINNKENYYLATDERAYENKVANCLMIMEKDI